MHTALAFLPIRVQDGEDPRETFSGYTFPFQDHGYQNHLNSDSKEACIFQSAQIQQVGSKYHQLQESDN